MLGLRRKRKDDVDVRAVLENLQRLEAINATHLIGSEPRPEFDDLAEKASDALRTPMAFLSIVTADRTHLVGAAGLDGELEEVRQVACEESYCQHVVAFDDVLVVDNALADSLVADHSATADGVRAYLGVPIRKNGHTIGSFCVVDRKPRRWTDRNLATLEALAAQVTEAIG